MGMTSLHREDLATAVRVAASGDGQRDAASQHQALLVEWMDVFVIRGAQLDRADISAEPIAQQRGLELLC
jgi:hypothetical protein